MLKPEDIKIGARIKYLDSAQPDWVGKIGTIKKVYPPDLFDVYLDNGNPLGSYGPTWSIFTNFELLSVSPLPSVSALSRECPCGIFRGDCTYHKE